MFFYSKNMEHEDELSGAGYYTATLQLRHGGRLLRSNNERAFVISQLQDALRRYTTLEDPTIRHQLASHIDLLAFSITGEEIALILFSIHRPATQALLDFIAKRLEEYQTEWPTRRIAQKIQPYEFVATIRHLTGPHAALAQSVALHLRHSDWEYDRYSSIGFYLHDRRGDWMHLWRLSRLYENDNTRYRMLIMAKISQESPEDAGPTTQLFAPLSHAS